MSDQREETIAQLSNHAMLNMTLEEMMEFIYTSLSSTLEEYSDEELDELSELVNNENA